MKSDVSPTPAGFSTLAETENFNQLLKHLTCEIRDYKWTYKMQKQVFESQIRKKWYQITGTSIAVNHWIQLDLLGFGVWVDSKVLPWCNWNDLVPVGDDIATKWQKIWGSFWVCKNDLKDPTANCFKPMNCCLVSQ